MNLKTSNKRAKALHIELLVYWENVFELKILDQLLPLESGNYNPTEDLKTLRALWLGELKPYEHAGFYPEKKTNRSIDMKFLENRTRNNCQLTSSSD